MAVFRMGATGLACHKEMDTGADGLRQRYGLQKGPSRPLALLCTLLPMLLKAQHGFF